MILKSLEVFTHGFAKWAGSAWGFVAALGSIALWLLAGAVAGYPPGWQAGLNFYLSAVTFLMVFLIQRGQNKEMSVLQVKLNELIKVSHHADNKLINIEDLTEQEIAVVQDIHRKIGAEEGGN